MPGQLHAVGPGRDARRAPRLGRCLEGPRAAVDPLEQSLAREQLQVTVNGDRRDLEVARQLRRRRTAVAADALEDPLSAQRGRHVRRSSPFAPKDQYLTTSLA